MCCPVRGATPHTLGAYVKLMATALGWVAIERFQHCWELRGLVLEC